MSGGLYVFLDFLLSTFYLGEAPEPSEVRAGRLRVLAGVSGGLPN